MVVSVCEEPVEDPCCSVGAYQGYPELSDRVKYQTWFRGVVTTYEGRYEIDDMKPRVMIGSGSLNTNGMYPNLCGAVYTCKIGFKLIHMATHELGNHEARGNHNSVIAVILIMCFEVLRDKSDEQIGGKNMEVINNWADTSRDFYKTNDGKDEVFITDNTEQSVHSCAGVTILYRSAWDAWIQKDKKELYKACGFKNTRKGDCICV
ncbi:hypothetical protein BS78_08G098400 [Paspalum vaginatum]|nr:hypothetical protein BS78_08G098400 [Paspalum vaginatum]